MGCPLCGYTGGGTHSHYDCKRAREAQKANLAEWAKSLRSDEIDRLLGDDRHTRTPAEIAALVNEDRIRDGMGRRR